MAIKSLKARSTGDDAVRGTTRSRVRAAREHRQLDCWCSPASQPAHAPASGRVLPDLWSLRLGGRVPGARRCDHAPLPAIPVPNGTPPRSSRRSVARAALRLASHSLLLELLPQVGETAVVEPRDPPAESSLNGPRKRAQRAEPTGSERPAAKVPCAAASDRNIWPAGARPARARLDSARAGGASAASGADRERTPGGRVSRPPVSDRRYGLRAEFEDELGEGGAEDGEQEQSDHHRGAAPHVEPSTDAPGGTSVTAEPLCSPHAAAADARSSASDARPYESTSTTSSEGRASA